VDRGDGVAVVGSPDYGYRADVMRGPGGGWHDAEVGEGAVLREVLVTEPLRQADIMLPVMVEVTSHLAPGDASGEV